MANQHSPRDESMVDIQSLQVQLAEAKESLRIAEEVTRQERERLRLATQLTGLGVWDYNALIGERVWSDSMKLIFGFSPGTEASYDQWLASVHPDDRQRVEESVRKIEDASADTEYHDEYRIIRSDGTIRWIDSKGEAFFEEINGERRMVRFFGTVEDITDRKQSKERELQAREFLEKVLESLTHPFYVIDANDYTIKMANAASHFGDMSDTCTCFGLTHKRNKPCGGEHPCPLEEVRKTKRPVSAEHIHYDKDGTPRNVEVHGYPILDEEGNVVQMIEYCLDVTERKRAEEAVQVSQQMLQLVMDNIPQHIFWKDRNSVYLGCNKNFAADAGIDDPASIIGKTDYDLPWTRQQSEFFREYDRRVMEEDTPILHIIEPVLQADGKEAWLDTNKIPLYDAQGNVVGILGTYEDITERKLLEVEKENASKALQEVYERERRIAETLQRCFLPERIPEVEGYRFAQAYQPALAEAAIGGDVYDVFRLPSGKVGMAIADVSGKGLLAARYGAMVKYMLRAYSYSTEDPAETLALLNSSFCRDMDIDSFVTCFFGILDPDTGYLVYANAGHEEPLYIQHGVMVPKRIQVTGPILGLAESSTYTSGSISLGEGDVVLLYTDGVIDARGVQGPMYIDGLEQYLAANCTLPAESFVACVLDEVRRRSGDRLTDDVALVVLEVTRQPSISNF